MLGYNTAPKNPISLMDWHGHNDHIIPSNVSNSYDYPKYIAPDGAKFSSDGFYYVPTGNNTRQFAQLNGCGTNGNWKLRMMDNEIYIVLNRMVIVKMVWM